MLALPPRRYLFFLLIFGLPKKKNDDIAIEKTLQNLSSKFGQFIGSIWRARLLASANKVAKSVCRPVLRRLRGLPSQCKVATVHVDGSNVDHSNTADDISKGYERTRAQKCDKGYFRSRFACIDVPHTTEDVQKVTRYRSATITPVKCSHITIRDDVVVNTARLATGTIITATYGGQTFGTAGRSSARVRTHKAVAGGQVGIYPGAAA